MRRRRHPRFTALGSWALMAAWAASVPAAAATEWFDSTRDVYVDGRLDRTAQVFVARSDQVAVLASSLPRVVVFDTAELAVSSLDKARLEVTGDRSQASSEPAPAPEADAVVTEAGDGGYFVMTGGHAVLVALHQGLAGEITRAELWQTVPVWQALAAAYEPAPEVVAALRDVDRGVELTVVFGTWCGDSKHYVPALLKTLDEAANPAIEVRLVSIRRGFDSPLDFVREHRVINVPTIIVSEDGREIGRIVETPAGASVEADLAAILAGSQPPPHPGRWQRDRRLARGVYEYRDEGGNTLGTEAWELYSAEEDGRLLHSLRELGERSTEVWQRRDSAGATRFVEITRRADGELSRSRHWIGDGHLHVITRGNVTGIIDQKLELPSGALVVVPASAAAGQPQAALDPAAAVLETVALRLPGSGAPAAGQLEPLVFEDVGREEIDAPAGRFMTTHVTRRLAAETSQWWLHPELAIPVAGRIDGVGQLVLVELELGETESGDGSHR